MNSIYFLTHCFVIFPFDTSGNISLFLLALLPNHYHYWLKEPCYLYILSANLRDDINLLTAVMPILLLITISLISLIIC